MGVRDDQGTKQLAYEQLLIGWFKFVGADDEGARNTILSSCT